MAEKIVESLRRQEGSRRVEVTIQPDMTATGDARLMVVVLENLFENAWKFTHKQPNALIEFTSFDLDGSRVFKIRDNGIGFNMEYAEKIFQPFQRLHREEEYEGTGIGLATVQRIIHRHGGEVWAEANEGDGASFYFTLAA